MKPLPGESRRRISGNRRCAGREMLDGVGSAGLQVNVAVFEVLAGDTAGRELIGDGNARALRAVRRARDSG